MRHEGAKALAALLDSHVATSPPAPVEWKAPDVQDVLETQKEVRRILKAAVREPVVDTRFDDVIDRVVLHPLWGLPILAALLFFMFQAVFSWAQWPMEGVKSAMEGLGALLQSAMPEGLLRSLLGRRVACRQRVVLLRQICLFASSRVETPAIAARGVLSRGMG